MRNYSIRIVLQVVDANVFYISLDSIYIHILWVLLRYL